MADQAKGKGIAPKRASNPANLGQSSRPLLPVRTLLEDKEDGEDYSEVIEVLKDVSAIKNISSTLASLTNSSNAAATTTGKTSYTTSNLDPPMDTGSKEGFKDTITSSMVKELSKKAYTILDDKESRNLAIEAYRAAYVANSSNSTSNSNSNPSKEGKNKKKGQLRPINTGNGPVSPASIGSITLEVLSRKAPPTYTKLVLDNVLYLPNININIVSRVRHYDSGGCLIKETLYRGDTSYNTTQISEAIEPKKRFKLRNSPAKGTTLEGIGPSLRGKRPCRPVEPLATAQAPYQSPCKTREPKPLTGTRDLPHVLREPVIEGNKVVEKAISSPTLEEPNIAKRGIKFSTSAPYIFKQNGLVERSCFILEAIVELVNSIAITNKETTPLQVLFNKLEPGILHIPNLERYRAIGARGEAIIPVEKRSKSLRFTSRTEEYKLLVVLGSKTYLVYIPSRRAVLKTSTIRFIEDNTVLSQPTDNTALKGELVDLDLDLEGAVTPDPSNLNTEKPISIEIGPSKLEPYESSSDSELDGPLPDKPINPVIVETTRPTISIRNHELPEAFP
ncbi:hypothetical protein P8C59_005261 [Phyllachora maydis]|uniref:Uncharacterized protein n=1 Tax=Phyllachora maydis TaxID=1825666 RepID=A0AAD9I5R8_9PEZI|nr:hypothetical protein P8C59_005261 [Phyllachora maydis]